MCVCLLGLRVCGVGMRLQLGNFRILASPIFQFWMHLKARNEYDL